jgi:iron complex outermembrane receptor protein
MAHLFSRTRTALAAAALCCALAPAGAQTGTDTSTPTTTVTITGQRDSAPGFTGFGNQALARSPLQAFGYDTQQLDDSGITRIGGLTLLDASLNDAYNADGYWSMISARGYTLDNRFNYRRDGLPINAETAIALDNKESLEVLKGVSGIQAGTSAPGGIVNLVVKRPRAHQRSVSIGFRQSGSLFGAVDIGDRSGPDGAFGWRVNAAAEHLDPMQRDTQGHRTLLALATDWQINPDSLLEAEIEISRQSQPSVAGFSMRGNVVPSAKDIDPRLNLNHQPWNLPVVMNGNTASLRCQQRLSPDWRLKAQAMTQRLKSDDRTAFPYGVYDASTYDCAEWCDRFAPDGSFTYWQYVSNNERRTSDALEVALSGRARTGGIEHTIDTGVLQTRYRGRFEDQIFDIAGPGKDDGSLVSPPSPGTPDANTNRSERSTEFYLRDAMHWRSGSSVWLGLRHSRLARASERTSPDSDGSLRATDYTQGVSIPWVAVAQQLTPATLVYASWGQGLESDVAPNRPALYSNAGQALPALKSRQAEIGIKHAGEHLDATFALFDIDQPQAATVNGAYVTDGSEHHRGADGRITLRAGAWRWQVGAMLLNAERRGSNDASVNGARPVNVPRATLRLGTAYRVVAVPGLELQANFSVESDRVVLPYDQSVHIPGWSRLDLAARWMQHLAQSTLTWRAGIDNVTDRRAWKESPYEFDHVYLYPLAPRTLRIAVQASF